MPCLTVLQNFIFTWLAYEYALYARINLILLSIFQYILNEIQGNAEINFIFKQAFEFKNENQMINIMRNIPVDKCIYIIGSLYYRIKLRLIYFMSNSSAKKYFQHCFTYDIPIYFSSRFPISFSSGGLTKYFMWIKVGFVLLSPLRT